MGNLQQSLSDFNTALSLDDRNPIIFSNRGLVNRKLERYDEAITDYSKEIELTQNKKGLQQNIKALNNRAYCLAK